MSALLLILLSAVLVCYYAPRIAGMRPFETTEPFQNALGLALASLIAMTVVTPLGYAVEHLALEPLGVRYLRLLVLVMLIAALAHLIAFGLQRHGRWLPVRRRFVLLMTAHCAVLTSALLGANHIKGLTINSSGAALLSGCLTGLAFATLLLTFTTLMQRLRHADVPAPFREAPLALITAGLMGLALLGLTGLIRD